MTISEAVEVFGWRIHPGKESDVSVCRQSPQALALGDARYSGSKECSKREVISLSGDPSRTVNRIAEAGIGWHFICEIHSPEENFEAMRMEYKRLGYRAVSTEWLFVHSLANLPPRLEGVEIIKVDSQEILASIPQTASQKRKLWLEPPSLRFMMASRISAGSLTFPCSSATGYRPMVSARAAGTRTRACPQDGVAPPREESRRSG